ncbi:MAG: hypothetical protein QOE53_3118 [Pseudonocardiales bacterium]|jgi:predicted short-subunit dehydrogenase-like oxidoreductase (DUF2520 family)|nr:hypothetical protein [Pseudonocardiales bacterium]
MGSEAVTTTGWTSKQTDNAFLPSRYLVRELDRTPSQTPPPHCAVIGAGRLGHALAAALRDAGLEVDGPLGRGADPHTQVALLTVPDAEIAAAAAALTPLNAQFVGHCSGATTLEPLHPHEAFSLHPLMTVPEGSAAPFAGAGCAIAGSTERALETARALAGALGMRPVHVADEDRAAYHAAASIAANFLVTLEGAAERLAATAGVPRELLVPLARAALENWAAQGAEQALTGPVARGDEATIARQRLAIEERAPDLLDLFDVLVAASRVVVAT